MKIGLTGSIACGKSTVSSYLRTLGYDVADADAISRALTAQGGAALPAIRQAFGCSVFFEDGTLNRRALGSIVFSSEENRAMLNALLHPMIISEIRQQMDDAAKSGSHVFADIPLLYECGIDSLFDQVWVVSTSEETQIARLAVRDGLNREEAVQRIRAQMPLSEKETRADAVIRTEGSIENTQAQVRKLLEKASEGRQA